MEHRDWRDVTTGLALVAVGIAFWTVGANYRMGTMTRIGPGFAPMVLSIALAAIGLAVAATGLTRARTEFPRLAIRPAVVILSGIAVFAATVRSAGLMPATVLLVTIATLADGRVRPLFSLGLALALAALAYTIFIALLGLPIPAFSRRFLAMTGFL